MGVLNDSSVIFEIEDDSGGRRKISVGGFHVEVLSKHLPDFRSWLQEQYLVVERDSKGVSARAIGNKVRGRVKAEAEKSPHYKDEMERLAQML